MPLSQQATLLSGNTAGSSVVYGAPMVISGGANVTVQASLNTLIVSAAAGGTGAGAGIALAAGTQTATTNTVVFSNSNGVTFGMSGSSRVTASVETSYAASNHSHGNPTLALTNLTGTTASASNGFTLSLSAAAPGAGGGIAAAAGTQTATSGTVVFLNSNGLTFGMSNSSQITGSYTVPTQTVQPGIQSISAGTTRATTGEVVFSNSNGVSFGVNGNTVTATVATNYLTSQSNQAVSGANGSFTFQTLSFANSNGVSWSTGTQGLFATVATNYLTTARASNDAIGLNTAQSNVTWTVNSSGLSLDARGYAGTGTSATNASITLNSNGLAISVAAPGGGAAQTFSAGTTSGAANPVVFSNSNGVSFGYNAGTITATVATDYAVSTHSHGNPTLALTNLSGTTASASNGLTLSLSAAAPGGGAAQTFSAGTTSGSPNPIYFSDSNGVSFGLNGSTVTASVARNATIQSYEPNNLLTGSAFSSHAPGTTYWMPLGVVQDVAFRWVDVVKSLSIAFPAGTSSATAQSFRHGYTHYVSLFSRVNTSNSSESLSYMTHGSLVATYSFTHTSTSMGATLFYNTNSTGGTSSTNSTSGATANLAAYFNGARLARIPFPATTLSAGEYWFAQAHSSSSAATSGTATTVALYSNLHIAPQNVNVARFASTNATNASIGYLFPVPQGVANAHTSNANMNMSAISASVINNWYVKLMDH